VTGLPRHDVPTAIIVAGRAFFDKALSDASADPRAVVCLDESMTAGAFAAAA